MEPKYVRFDLTARKSKTLVWTVHKKDSPVVLGRVAWFGRWRCYAFEHQCLRDIAAFCEEQTKKHRQAKRGARAAARPTTAGD